MLRCVRHLSKHFLALLAILLLSGCRSGNLVGTWDGQANGQTASFTFNPDGSLIVTADAPDGSGMRLKMIGAYEQNMHYLTVGVSDVELENLPPHLEARKADLIKRVKAGMPLNQPHRGPLEWVDNDTIQATHLGETMTLRRRK